MWSILKFEHQITIKSYAASTIFSYSRGVAQISLYFNKSPLDLEPDEINAYLYELARDKNLSKTYFKLNWEPHTYALKVSVAATFSSEKSEKVY